MSGAIRRRLPAILVGVLLASATASPVRAEESVLPESCKTHPTKVLNPGCVPALVERLDPDELTFPDLVPDVTDVFLWRTPSFDPNTGIWTYGPPELWFDTLAQNLGTVPFDLMADDPTEMGGSVSQCVRWTTDLVCRERRPAGGFIWHEPHRHFHFEDFAAYQLRRLLVDGSTDYSDAGLVAVSEKVSFCLVDSMPVSADALPVGRYPTCTWVNQGISPGWADVYSKDLPGQQLPVSSITDGRYALVVDMDTADRVAESDEVHNRVEIIVEISGGVNEAAIVDRRRP